MDDAVLVRRFERLGDLARDRQGLVKRYRPAAMRALRSSPSTSSITSARSVGLLEPVDLRDVRVVQRGQHSGFALEPHQTIGIAGERSGRIFSATSRPSFVSRAR